MLRILHVEDDPLYLAAVRDSLCAVEGVILEQVDTLEAAQQRLVDTTAPAIDALLLDLRLPDAREMEAVATLRVYGVPIVVLSATARPEHLERAAEAGADDYIVKGSFVDAAQIVRRVRFACRRYTKQVEAVASAVNVASSSRSPFRRSFELSTFEALKPFITCGSSLRC